MKGRKRQAHPDKGGILIFCPCGNSFYAWPHLIRDGKGKFCSKECAYKFYKKSSGFKRVDKIPNPSWFKKGQEPPNKGIPCSDELKEYYREIHKGKRYSPNTEFKKGQFVGDKHPLWKGGITPENTRIRNSDEYKLWRKLVFIHDNFTCVECGSKKQIEADHIQPFAYFTELRFDVSNGRTLCHSCHEKTPTYRNGARKLYERS